MSDLDYWKKTLRAMDYSSINYKCPQCKVRTKFCSFRWCWVCPKCGQEYILRGED